MAKSTDYQALVAEAKQLGVKRANTIKAEELQYIVNALKVDNAGGADSKAVDPNAKQPGKPIEEELGATGEQVREAPDSEAVVPDEPKLATDEQGRYQTTKEKNKEATIISDSEMDIEMSPEAAQAAGFSQEITADTDDLEEEPESVISELKPGRIIIHEDLDELQLIDVEMTTDKGPGATLAIVDTVRMNGIRGRGRRRLIKQFRSRATSIGYKIIAVENKIP